MTGIEIAAIVIIAVCAVALLLLCYAALGALADWLAHRKRNRSLSPPDPGFTVSDVSLRATRPVVLVGQNTDIRFYFTVTNGDRQQLRYEAKVLIDGVADVPPQTNTFGQNHLRTEVPRLHCKWTTVGTKRVSANLSVWRDAYAQGTAITALAEGSIEVVAKLEDEERPS